MVGSAMNAHAMSCWMRTVVLGKTKQSSRIGPEFRNDGWVAAQRNAPIVTHSVEKTTRYTAVGIGSSDCNAAFLRFAIGDQACPSPRLIHLTPAVPWLKSAVK